MLCHWNPVCDEWTNGSLTWNLSLQISSLQQCRNLNVHLFIQAFVSVTRPHVGQGQKRPCLLICTRPIQGTSNGNSQLIAGELKSVCTAQSWAVSHVTHTFPCTVVSADRFIGTDDDGQPHLRQIAARNEALTMAKESLVR